MTEPMRPDFTVSGECNCHLTRLAHECSVHGHIAPQTTTLAKAAYWFYRMVGNDGPDGSDLDEAIVQDIESALRDALPRDEYPLWGEDQGGEF